ncbi:tryptophan-rich sensory protein [Micromonospora sp. NPDC000089]|uniref:tryptophan-rich sensory protein n=1 Tax=unclassified Micromonospora TaxID=2617518 RepID=UPI0036B00C2F
MSSDLSQHKPFAADPARAAATSSWIRRAAAPVGFVAAVTAVGAGAAAISFAVTGGNPSVDGSLAYPAWWPPDWVFAGIWLIIYPASGMAAWRLWQQRHVADVRGALTAFALMNISSALFLPIASLVGGEPSVLTLMDLNGVIAVYALAWLFSRYSRPAAAWLLPYLVWMPLTAALKIWLWTLN